MGNKSAPKIKKKRASGKRGNARTNRTEKGRGGKELGEKRSTRYNCLAGEGRGEKRPRKTRARREKAQTTKELSPGSRRKVRGQKRARREKPSEINETLGETSKSRKKLRDKRARRGSDKGTAK